MSQVPPPPDPDQRMRVSPPAASPPPTGQSPQITIDTGGYEPIPSRRRNRNRRSSWLPTLVRFGMGLFSVAAVVGVCAVLMNTTPSVDRASTDVPSTDTSGSTNEAVTEIVDSSGADSMTEQDWLIASAALEASLENVHDVQWDWRPLYAAIFTTTESGGLTTYNIVTSRAEAEAALPDLNSRLGKTYLELFESQLPPLLINRLERVGTEFTVTFKGEVRGTPGSGDAVIRVGENVGVVGTPIEVDGKPTGKEIIEVRRRDVRIGSIKTQNFSGGGMSISTAGSQRLDARSIGR